MSEELDQNLQDQPASPADDPMATLNDGEPCPAPVQPPNQTRNLLMLAGIFVIVVGAAALTLLGPTFTLHPPPPPPEDTDVVRVQRLLNKWERMNAAQRSAAIPELVAAFKIKNEDLRLAVLLTIADAGTEAVPDLIKALGDDDSTFYAAWALGRIGPRAADALPALLEARTDVRPDVRCKVIYAVGRIHPPAERAVPVLIECFKDFDSDVRSTARTALVAYGVEAVPALTRSLSHGEFQVRQQALLALAQLGPDAAAALPKVQSLYLDRASDVKDEAAAVLSSLGKSAVPILAEPLHTDPTAPSGQVILGFGSPWALLGVWREYDVDHRRALAGLRAAGPDAVETLVAALNNPNIDVREQAAANLGSMGYRDQRVIGPLVQALSDPEESVREQARIALNLLAPDVRQLIPGLRRVLQNPNINIRYDAVTLLAGLGTPAVPLVVEALKDADKKVHQLAIQAAANFVDKVQVDPATLSAAVLPLLKDDRPTVRQNAVRVLHRCGPVALTDLIGAMSDPDVGVRLQAIEAVSAMPADTKEQKLIDPALRTAALDPDATVRAMAVAGLGKRVGFGALSVFQQALKDKEPEVRLKAVEALGRLDPVFEAVIPTLLSALRDESPAVRLATISKLARFPDPAVVQPLIEAFKDPEVDVWKRARDVLLKIEVPDKLVLPEIAKASRDTKDENRFVRQGAIYVLPRFKSEGVPYLIEALKDDNPRIQFMAADALDNIGGWEAYQAIPALVEIAVKHPDEKVSRTAVMALTTTNGFAEFRKYPLKAIPGLITLLSDDDRTKRWGAAQALRAIGPPAQGALPALTKLLKDPEASVRESAGEAIKRIEKK